MNGNDYMRAESRIKGKKGRQLRKTQIKAPKDKLDSFQAQISKGKISPRILGEAGESVGAYYFKTKGYRVIGRNIRFKRGEVDILALKDDIIRIIEVKTVMVRSDGPAKKSSGGPSTDEEGGMDVIHETRIEQFEPEYNFTQAKISRLKAIGAEIVSKYPYPLLHLIDFDHEAGQNPGVINDGGEIRVHIEGLAVRILVDRTTIKSIRVRHIEDLVS